MCLRTLVAGLLVLLATANPDALAQDEPLPTAHVRLPERILADRPVTLTLSISTCDGLLAPPLVVREGTVVRVSARILYGMCGVPPGPGISIHRVVLGAFEPGAYRLELTEVLVSELGGSGEAVGPFLFPFEVLPRPHAVPAGGALAWWLLGALLLLPCAVHRYREA